MIDLLVVGAGPAGLATALHAARRGLETVVVDARAAPLDKACGEGLMPVAVRALADLGVTPRGHELRGIRYVDGRRHVDAAFRSGPGRGVRRTELQEALLDAVGAAGVPVLQRRVATVRQDGSSVCAAGITARYLAAADGLHSAIRDDVGLYGRPASRASRWGLRQHFVVAPWSDMVEVHWGPRAEVYVTPVGPELVGVAVLTGERAPFAEQLAAFPEVASRLPPWTASRLRGAGPLHQPVRGRVAGRVLLVGDAAGYVDALTGEGVAVAIECAAALVRSVAEDRPDRYERRWLRASRRYRLITEALLWARRRPMIAPAIVPAAARLPRTFAAAVNRLAR
ncbi:NAD(P)/FAD-dependent oxidoreductase [Actinomycetes bacterium KLBMP 9759]